MNKNMLQAYLKGDQTVRSWFGGNWDSTEALSAWTPGSSKWKRSHLHTILKANCDRYQVSAQTRDHIKALKQDDTYLIISGQQPAIGGGPLYTLIKVAQSIALARTLREAGKQVLPLFWCASEDHDEGECNHADFIGRDGQVSRVSKAFEHSGASLRFQAASLWWQDIFDHCMQTFGDGLGKQFLLTLKPLENESTSAWLCRFLSQMFAEDGLICVEAHDLRPLWEHRVDDFAARWPRLALAKRRGEVLEAGFNDSFNGLLQHAPLFIDEKSGRQAIDLMDGRKVKNVQRNLGLESGSISTGAGLRPIVQQLVLPGLGFVGGPGELQYHAFLGPLYQEFLAPMPRFIPRTHVSLLPNWLQRYVQAWDLDITALNRDSIAPLLTDSDSAIDQQLHRVEHEINKLSNIPHQDAQLQQRSETGINKLQDNLKRMRQSISRGRRQKRRLPPFGHIKDFLFPRGQRHERVMSISQAAWLYGPGIGRVLVEHCAGAEPGQHSFLKL